MKETWRRIRFCGLALAAVLLGLAAGGAVRTIYVRGVGGRARHWARRMRFGKGTKAWDKVWAVLFTPVMIAIYVVAGLEARDGVSNLPVWCTGHSQILETGSVEGSSG